MATLGSAVLELGEGFTSDQVIVLVDGREIWRRDDVTTNYSVGLAEIVELPGTPATVEVRARGSAAAADLGSNDGDGVRLRAVLDSAGALHLGPAPADPQYF